MSSASGVVARVVAEARRSRVGELLDEVAAPDLGRVDTQLVGEQIHHPLDHVRGLGTPGTPVRVGRRRVREGPAAGDVHLLDVVGAGHHEDRQMRDRRGDELQVRAVVLDELDAKRLDASVAVRSKLDVLELVAPVDRREHRLGAALDPLDRRADELGRLCDRELLGVAVELRAEAAADVGCDHAAAALGDPADQRDEGAQVVGDLRRAVERQLVSRGAPVGEHRAGLDRNRSQALVVDRLADLDRRGIEDGVEALGLVRERAAEVPRRVVVQQRGTWLERVLGVNHDGGRLVVDDDAVDRVARGRAIRGDDERHRLAEHAHTALGEHRALDVLRVAEGIRGARDAGLDAERLGRQHPDDTRKRLGGGRVDRQDVGRGVRRAHERGMQHPGELEVVDEPPLTCDQRGVFLAQRARTDSRAGRRLLDRCHLRLPPRGGRPRASRPPRCSGSRCSDRGCPRVRRGSRPPSGSGCASSSCVADMIIPGVQ